MIRVEDRHGPSGAEDWFAELRRRFLAVAGRRVPSEMVEDIVQDALGVVYEKGVQPGLGDEVDGRPALAWCFQVLRNTIGNYYQRERTRSAHIADDAEPELVPATASGTTPLEALHERQVETALAQALDDVDRDGGQCGRYLRELAAGRPPVDLATDEGVVPAVFYRRVYRCRQRLREVLRERGVLT